MAANARGSVSGPLLMSPKRFAELNGLSPSTVYDLLHGKESAYPPLAAKRVGRRLYITAEQARAWRDALPDA